MGLIIMIFVAIARGIFIFFNPEAKIPRVHEENPLLKLD